jgi:hypothetical protein
VAPFSRDGDLRLVEGFSTPLAAVVLSRQLISLPVHDFLNSSRSAIESGLGSTTRGMLGCAGRWVLVQNSLAQNIGALPWRRRSDQNSIP